MLTKYCNELSRGLIDLENSMQFVFELCLLKVTMHGTAKYIVCVSVVLSFTKFGICIINIRLNGVYPPFLCFKLSPHIDIRKRQPRRSILG